MLLLLINLIHERDGVKYMIVRHTDILTYFTCRLDALNITSSTKKRRMKGINVFDIWPRTQKKQLLRGKSRKFNSYKRLSHIISECKAVSRIILQFSM
jgi:hypothetical protein